MNGITNFRHATNPFATVNVTTDDRLFCMKYKPFDNDSIAVRLDLNSDARPSPDIDCVVEPNTSMGGRTNAGGQISWIHAT